MSDSPMTGPRYVAEPSNEAAGWIVWDQEAAEQASWLVDEADALALAARLNEADAS